MGNAHIHADKLHRNETWLRKTYVDEGKTMQEIADSQGVTAAAIYGMLKKFEIPTRRRGRHILNCTCGACPSTKPGAAAKPKPSRAATVRAVPPYTDPQLKPVSINVVGSSTPQEFATEIGLGELRNLQFQLQQDLDAINRTISLLE